MTPLHVDLSRLAGVTLLHGHHKSKEEGMCVMELVSYITGGPFTDMPQCVPRDIAIYATRVNDSHIWDTDQDRTNALLPFVSRILGAEDGFAARYRRLQWGACHTLKSAARVSPEFAVLAEIEVPSTPNAFLGYFDEAHTRMPYSYPDTIEGRLANCVAGALNQCVRQDFLPSSYAIGAAMYAERIATGSYETQRACRRKTMLELLDGYCSV